MPGYNYQNIDIQTLAAELVAAMGTTPPGPYSGVALEPIISRNSGAIDLTALGQIKMASFVNNGTNGTDAQLLGEPFKDGEIATFNALGSSDYFNGSDFVGDGNGNDILIVIVK